MAMLVVRFQSKHVYWNMYIAARDTFTDYNQETNPFPDSEIL